MTGTADNRCSRCGRGFTRTPGPGRPRRYCSDSCRQLDYQARRRAAEVGLGERELVITRDELNRLYDQLWILECAVEDTDRDLSDARTLGDYRRIVDWLLEAARPLAELRPG
ncbi:MAG TPA: hypothetical protein VF855_02545 [Acidimicrobiales bacterium]